MTPYKQAAAVFGGNPIDVKGIREEIWLMDICNREFLLESFDQDEKIFVRLWEPSERKNARAVLQIAHGMAEHSRRYVPFAQYLSRLGYVVCIHDHAGHGRSVKAGDSYGYFGDAGYRRLVEDMHSVRLRVQSEYPSLPFAMMGHSMGSFLTRSYLAKYGKKVSAALLCGTSAGRSPAAMRAGKALAETIIRKEGPRAYSERLHKAIFGDYNKKFKPVRTEEDWLTRDEAEVDRYRTDPLCGFLFTASGYLELIRLLTDVNRPEWFQNMPDIPVLLASGEMDPVGDYGKGVKKVAEKLRKTGHSVTLKLYPNARHELLNETNRQQVYEDLRDFLQKSLFLSEERNS